LIKYKLKKNIKIMERNFMGESDICTGKNNKQKVEIHNEQQITLFKLLKSVKNSAFCSSQVEC